MFRCCDGATDAVEIVEINLPVRDRESKNNDPGATATHFGGSHYRNATVTAASPYRT